MDLKYSPGHAKRYAHISKSKRWKYHAEIKIGMCSPIKRTKPFKDITLEEAGMHGVDPCLLANDVPFTEGCVKV